MSEMVPFLRSFINESARKNSLDHILQSDFNRQCGIIHELPVNLATSEYLEYFEPRLLYAYLSKEDYCKEEWQKKSAQFIESLHSAGQIVWELRGNKERIYTCFYSEKQSISLVDAAFRACYPRSFTEISEPETILTESELYIYDFIPQAPFYMALVSDFVSSPLNAIAQLFLNLKDNAVYQVIFASVSNKYNELVKSAIDIEYKALLGAEMKTFPSIQINAVNKRKEYKNPDFNGSYFSVSFRIIVPSDSFSSYIEAFIGNYTYGGLPFRVIKNSYNLMQLKDMFWRRYCFHSGFLMNSSELSLLYHAPFQLIFDNSFNDIFMCAPVGDKPKKMAENSEIPIGKWACGNSSIDTYLVNQREYPHCSILGLSRTGKSICLASLAYGFFSKGIGTAVFDPHGDLCETILKMIPRELMDQVVVVDFGLKDFTPQITIKDNVDITNPGKISDDLSQSMYEVSATKERFFGPRMAYVFQCLFFLLCICDLDLVDLRQIISPSKKARVLRNKLKALVDHPIIKEFLDELSALPYEMVAPVFQRLSHMLIDIKNLRLFTLKKNKISLAEIMENKLILINLAVGIIGKQRASILYGLLDSLFTNNLFARAALPYEKRKQFILIKDELSLCNSELLDIQFSGLAKYGLSVICATQFLSQLREENRQVFNTASTRVTFRLKHEDALFYGKEFNINPGELMQLKKFQAFIRFEDELIKINTPRPSFNKEDLSREIMQNCLNKYYFRHDSRISPREKLTYDLL